MIDFFRRIFNKPISIRPDCGHTALMAAKTWRDKTGDAVRIAHGDKHVQARRWDGERWVAIGLDREPVVQDVMNDFPFAEPDLYTIEHFELIWRNPR